VLNLPLNRLLGNLLVVPRMIAYPFEQDVSLLHARI
jgi:hypothetical protein